MKMIKSITVPLILCISLSACVPAALVVGATAGGAVVYDRRGIKTKLDDTSISQKAYAAIKNDPSLQKNTRFSLAVFNGIVLMLGEVQTEEQRERAYTLVAKVPDVKRIFNQMTVGPIAPLSARAHSSLITAQVKAAMLGKPGLRSTQVKVVTNNKVVYLMGVTSHRQANLAVDTARRVTSVAKVVKVFEYEN
jgi:osmotically-inducible protein OsmY